VEELTTLWLWGALSF